MSIDKAKVKEVMGRGLIRENPIFRLVLGMCSSLAVSTSMIGAFGMSVSVIVVLICSNIVISLLRNFIPNTVRIPAYITVIAGFVTIVQMVIKALAPDIDKMLGIYLPLIVVNCIILGRAEAFANKNGVFLSALDGLSMGLGYTLAMMSISFIRELLGAGTLFGIQIIPASIPPIMLFALPAGGFLVLGILMAVCNRIAEHYGQPKAELGCESCAAFGRCPVKEFEASQHETHVTADQKIAKVGAKAKTNEEDK